MKKIALFFLAFTFSMSMWMVPSTIAKTVRIPSVDMVVTIRPDGSAYVQENRTIEFDGDFTFGFYEIPKKGFGTIQNVSVAEGDQYYQYESISSRNQGTFTLSDTGSSIRIDFYFFALDETRTFTIRYEIKDVVSVYQDYGEFYWMLEGDGWDFAVQDFSAVVQWQDPVPLENYFIWGHGPLWGNFNKSDETSAFLHVENLAANTFVETRVLLPSSYFTAPKKEGTIYERVLQEETVWANEANAERQSAKKMIWIATILKWLMVGLAIFFILLYFFLYNKYGREHQITNASIYYREPPSDLKPAIVGMLVSFQNYQDRFLEATLMDLIRRKHIQYEEIPGNFLTKDHKLTRLTNKEDTLEDYEDFLMEELLFERKTSVTMRGLKKKYRASNDWYYGQFQKFKKMIRDTTKTY
ncbi:MAG: DUF2207 domain-containing protein, partial [Caldisericia bacterium]|nr:DUF2207 domain-containing protein [Caldisericia bacterium]